MSAIYMVGAFFANERAVVEFQKTELYQGIKTDFKSSIFTNDFLLDLEICNIRQLHENMCKYNYRPYVDFIRKYLSTIRLIDYVEFNKNVFVEFLLGNSFDEHLDMFGKVRYRNSARNIIECIYSYVYYAFMPDGDHMSYSDKNDYGFMVSIYAHSTVACSDEIAHIYWCSVPNYVTFCKNRIMLKTGLAHIYDELQTGNERSLLSDECIVATIEKFL